MSITISGDASHRRGKFQHSKIEIGENRISFKKLRHKWRQL